jgi:hypothetical protein
MGWLKGKVIDADLLHFANFTTPTDLPRPVNTFSRVEISHAVDWSGRMVIDLNKGRNL